MNFYRALFTSGLILLSIFSNGSLALAEKPENTAISDISAVLLKTLERSKYEEQYVYLVLNNIRTHASDRVALTANDIKRIEEQKIQQHRQHTIQNLIRHDMDFDGTVTLTEIEQSLTPSKYSNQQHRDNFINSIMKADANEDGVVTREEMIAYADQELEKKPYRNNRQSKELQELLALDPNNDKKLSAKELAEISIKAFRAFDSDNDGTLSEDEKKNIRDMNKSKQEQERLAIAGCMPTKAENNEKIIFISAYEGNAISTISVAGQEKETNVIPVQIDNGDEKLYIVAASFSPTIWQFKGDTDRISKLLLAGPRATDSNVGEKHKINTGATGVTADKITFQNAHACGIANAYNKDPSKKKTALAALKRILGRQPDLYYSEYNVTGFHIFRERVNTDISKEIEDSQKNPPDGFDEDLWSKHIQYMPGGVIDLTGEKIVSDSPAIPYEVLPKWAGFSKLAYEGAIIPANNKNSRDNKNSTVIISGPGRSSITINNIGNIKLEKNGSKVSFERGNRVKIVKNIPYYPSGLYGGYSAEIIIGKGIKPPKGTPGHSTVILEETGKKIAGPGMHQR